MIKDRKVSVKFKDGLFNCCLEGEAKFGDNQQCWMFALSMGEARELTRQIRDLIKQAIIT